MVLIIQNVTPNPTERGNDELHDYAVRVNTSRPIAYFKHRRDLGAAECLRAAADAIDAARNAEIEALVLIAREGLMHGQR
jgi:hypothetical protein